MWVAVTAPRLLLLGALGLAPEAGRAQSVRMAASERPDVQTLTSGPARLRVAGVPLVAALGELAERSGVPLAYSPSLLPADLRVSCDCDSVSLGEALGRILKDTPLSFREAEGQVLLVPRRAQPEGGGGAAGVDPAARAPLAAGDPAPAQEPATLTGRVTSEAGAPVGGAAVRLSAPPLSTVTDEAGGYRLVVPAGQAGTREETLSVTRIGYRPRQVAFTLRPGPVRVDVALAEQAVALDEVLVTGTAGNQERRAQPAVVATIDASRVVREAPVASVTQLLQARVAGMSLTQSSGTTGSSARINIRGASSISLSNQPLVFLDGVRIEGGARSLVNVSGSAAVGQSPSALDDLNPDDIESIEVVKGPAAATLYGADASAGVIQIITKRGRAGTRSLTQDLTLEYGTIDPNFTVPSNYARCTAGLVAPDGPNPFCRGRSVGTVVSDNPAVRIGAFRDGEAASLKYSARGGGERFGYFVSLGVVNEDGTTRNNRLEQRTGRVNFTFSPGARLTFDVNLSLSHARYDLPRTDQDAYGYYIQSILGSPLTVREAADGTLTGGLLFGSSSLESLSSIVSQVTALRAIPSVQVRYAPWPWLTHRLTLGADYTQGEGFQFFPRNDQGWYPDRLATGNGDVTATREDDRSYTVDYLGNVQVDFGPDGRFSSNLSFGSQYIHRTLDRLSGFGAGLVTNGAHLVTNTAVSTVDQGYAESKALGLFVQEQLGYRDRLFVQVGLRADRNSAFGSEVGTFFLPKLGASYVVSEEPFWDRVAPFVSTLRLRGAYGTTGRSPSAGASLRSLATAKYVSDAGVISLGVVPANPGNERLKPERGSELELGLDAGFLDDRIGAELTWFNKKTTDLLVTVPVPPSSGFASSPFRNVGEVVNRGVELLLRATPVSRRDLVWDLSFNGSTLHNEIVDLGDAGTFINNFRAFAPGRQIAAWWVHRVRAVDEAAGRVVVSDTAEFAGNQLPTVQGSLASTFTLFRNVRVYTLFEGKGGYRVLNLNQEFRDRSSRSSASVNLPAGEGGYSAAERLRRLGPYVTEGSGAPVGAANVKEPYLQKGDHIRFQELSATYSLPARLARRMGARAASLTVGGRNLALWAPDYEGHDPEVLGVGPQATGLNQLFNSDVFTTPPSRRWIVRLNLQF